MLDNDSLINCNNTKRIRISFQKGLDAIFLHAAKIKSKSKVQPIDSLCNTVVIKEGKYITLKPSALFSRFTAVAQREDDMKKLFEYEMTAITMCLFKDWMMHKPDKVTLRDHFTTIQCKMKETPKEFIYSCAVIQRAL